MMIMQNHNWLSLEKNTIYSVMEKPMTKEQSAVVFIPSVNCQDSIENFLELGPCQLKS